MKNSFQKARDNSREEQIGTTLWTLILSGEKTPENMRLREELLNELDEIEMEKRKHADKKLTQSPKQTDCKCSVY